jgi:hypothetical protein
MDAFETLVAAILQSHGFWVRTGVKVELSQKEKYAINRPRSPRWELDVVAYRPSDNELWIVECKSFLNSQGVKTGAFSDGHAGPKRYKLFTEENTRKVVQKALVRQLRHNGALQGRPRVHLCLAAGHIARDSKESLKQHFRSKRWKLFDPDWIRDELLKLADVGYQNDVATMTVKLLNRQNVATADSAD